MRDLTKVKLTEPTEAELNLVSGGTFNPPPPTSNSATLIGGPPPTLITPPKGRIIVPGKGPV